MARKKRFLLDTSALLALRGEEPGADQVEQVLRQAERDECSLLVSFMTRMELLYLITREESEEAARQALLLLDAFGLEWVSCEPDILEVAARLKARGRLSLADSWIGATAIVRSAVLVHKDPEFSNSPEIPQRILESR